VVDDVAAPPAGAAVLQACGVDRRRLLRLGLSLPLPSHLRALGSRVLLRAAAAVCSRARDSAATGADPPGSTTLASLRASWQP
jgi:hypothetical protein